MTLDSARTRRLAAVGALGLFWAAFLLAVGVPLEAILAAAALAGAAALVALRGRQGGRVVALGAARAVDWLRREVRPGVARALRSLGRTSKRGGRIARAAAARGSAAGRRALRTLRARAQRARSIDIPERDLRVEAWRLNQESASLRQADRTAEAVDRAHAALLLFRRLGDRRGEALTLNSMALALARRGESDDAIARFGEALELLGALGDAHGEGQVMANLGALNRRQGHEQEAQACWRDALARLDPGSPERERIAEQLRLAS
jgi:tetratricopeptide (TPR) repeat protein